MGEAGTSSALDAIADRIDRLVNIRKLSELANVLAPRSGLEDPA